VNLIQKQEVIGNGIIYLMSLMVNQDLQESFMAPKGVISENHYFQIQDFSQLFHDGLGAYGVVRSPLLQFEILRFTHEVLQLIPESFKTKFSRPREQDRQCLGRKKEEISFHVSCGMEWLQPFPAASNKLGWKGALVG
jgi:hypothetical protein